MPWPMVESSGIRMPNSAIEGIVMMIDAVLYIASIIIAIEGFVMRIEAASSTASAARRFCVIAMPVGTPVRIATPTETETSETCSSIRCPITGRFAMMKAIVSTAVP